MTNNNLIRFITIGSILTIVGFILLFFSTYFGTSMAENWLMKQGGADTALFHIMIESYITNFVVAGGILLGIGLVTTLVTSFMILNVK
ncbi:hypothetical protein IMZ08_18120 [Bacillus luteolus]|uniref:NADH dehydrogenase subunit 6 n=1 Tax=Litchfieldia luteola TaxID=682179 RepID=A0ABR9QN70_9BACI|nr:hypothetical protein [Cytobacillus luteolus]MBE4909956.1 hypothetical protein [Cytobacillus luteolus]MBP1942487.1 ABC-type multidrug transport system permease subunit [Cytobacillus luteolus]